MRHRGEKERVGGRKLTESHHGAVYQKISDVHKADHDGPSTLYRWGVFDHQDHFDVIAGR